MYSMSRGTQYMPEGFWETGRAYKFRIREETTMVNPTFALHDGAKPLVEDL